MATDLEGIASSSVAMALSKAQDGDSMVGLWVHLAIMPDAGQAANPLDTVAYVLDLQGGSSPLQVCHMFLSLCSYLCSRTFRRYIDCYHVAGMMSGCGKVEAVFAVIV